MRAETKARASHKARKARTAATVQASPNFINCDALDDSLQQHQVQRLINLAGLSPHLARTIAPLAYGGAA